MNKKLVTETGTNIEEVKRLNAASGDSYNDVKRKLAAEWIRNNQNKPPE